MSEPWEDGIPCLWMRGGTSKGLVFLASDLPGDRTDLDPLLLRIMGSPDPRQIDGAGGADPLTSKAAILSPSGRTDADVDYLFLQVYVEQATVSDAQGCGNILAAVGPAAIERGLVRAEDGETHLRIHMVNTGEVAEARVSTPGGKVTYAGTASLDGVPGRHAAVSLTFRDLAGSICGALLPSGQVLDRIGGVDCTLIDNGMPCVILRAADLGVTGKESRAELDENASLKQRIEAVRLAAGPRMNLGDVAGKSVPKMVLVSPPVSGGAIHTRSFIPHRCHAGIGVFGAVSVGTACALPGSVAYDLADRPDDGNYSIEHPTGAAEIRLETDDTGRVTGASLTRTARKIIDGRVFPAPVRG
ncbi:4-oxalomesaconate tautomerase [Ruegeria marina]|uniref:4-oxalomesaconate tautomerase n=1 Tax=Ruegeria marina TaxID=639004 RepID=A0A1G7BMK4_9RHOB|nr:4-oxalomesaconate tautomerase [Ruegeria marina]SDE27435.1 4-oxalomesaconate tautomerase [Ruegeria marina]